MSGPRSGWLSVLHALSLGVQIEKDGRSWKFIGSGVEVDDEIVRAMVDKMFIKELTKSHTNYLVITPAGRRTLFSELNSIIDRTVARWPNPPKGSGGSNRQK